MEYGGEVIGGHVADRQPPSGPLISNRHATLVPRPVWNCVQTGLIVFAMLPRALYVCTCGEKALEVDLWLQDGLLGLHRAAA